jgi:hypothetical protein
MADYEWTDFDFVNRARIAALDRRRCVFRIRQQIGKI